jgi:hypothetical protein
MSEHLTWVVGNRNPSITENLVYEDGTPVDLTGATVAFKMRAVGSSTLKVNAAATVVGPAVNGNVRYDWAAVDVDTAGDWLVWWTVTVAGKTQDMLEVLIRIVAHAPSTGYVELEEIRSTLEIRETTHADKDLLLAIEAASAVVDMLCGQTFALEAAGTRKYTPLAEDFLAIAPVTSITSLSSNGTAWVEGTDYYQDDQAVLRTLNGRKFYRANQSVTIVGDFGFEAVPAEIKAATTIIASQIMKRAKEAPFGVLALTLDGSAIRIGRTDPTVDLMLAKWRRVMVA